MKAKILVAAAAIALLVGWWQPWNDAPRVTPALARGGETALELGEDRVLAIAPPESTGTDGERVALAPPAEDEQLSADFLEGRFEYEVDGTLFDQHDEPIAGAKVLLADPLGPWNLLGKTDQRGGFQLRFRARARRLDLLLRIQGADTIEESFRRCDFTAGRTELRLGLRTSGGSQVLLVSSTGQGSAQQLRLVSSQVFVDGRALRSRNLQSMAAGGLNNASAGSCEYDDQGFLHLAWPTEGKLVRELGSGQEQTLNMSFAISFSTASVQLTFPSGFGETAGPPTTLVEGTLIRPDGAPAAGARLVALRKGERTVTETDEQGSFAIETEPGAELKLKAGGGEDGIASGTLDLPADPAPRYARWDARLDRGAEISGTLRDDEGEPLAGRLVEVCIDTQTGLWSDTSLTGEDGRFSLPNLPSGAARLFLHSGEADPFAARIVTGVPVGGTPEHLQLCAADEAKGSLRLFVVDSPGNALSDVEVRVEQVETGRGGWLRPDDEGVYQAGSLPPGAWRVTAGNRGRGWIELGVIHVTAGAASELGGVKLPDPLPASFELPPDPDAEPPARWALLRRGESLDSVVWNRVPEAGLDDTLPRGEYVELRIDAEGEKTQRAFELR